MKLYTVQPLCVYELLCQVGLFHSRPLAYPESILSNFGDGFEFNLAYAWMMARMSERDLPRPHPEVYPLWAYYRWEGIARPKPDLRSSGMKVCGSEGRHVLMTVDIPDERVLLSDYFAWHYCLNYCYAGTVKASQAFDRRLRQAYGACCYHPLPEPFHQELLASWDLVLDLAGSRRVQHTRKDEQVIQATFWELRAAEVTAALAFGGGRLRERLPRPHHN